MALLTAQNLCLDYPTRDGIVRVLHNINFELHAGQTLGLVGESGSGKSQLSLALMGLLPKQAQLSGQLLFAGKDLTHCTPAQWLDMRGNQIGMIFQDPMTSLNPHLSIGKQLTEVLTYRGLDQHSANAEAIRMLEAVKVSEAAARLKQYPHEFSGGMRQRVMIAMMLLARPSLLIADEPTTALDVTVQAKILKLLAELKVDMGLTLLFISHDLGVIAEVADRVMVLYGGQIMESGATATLLAAPQHPYTQGLIACRPRLDTSQRLPMQTILGTPPRPSAPKQGCPFAPRCPKVLPQCANQTPIWQEKNAGQGSACHLNT